MPIDLSRPTVSQCVRSSPSGAVGADTSLPEAPRGKCPRWRTPAAASALAVAAAAAFVAVAARDDDAALRARPVIEHGALRYEFDTLTGREWLFDITVDGEPRCVLSERPEDARRLREELEDELGVASLDELRGAHSRTVDELRRLGYL